MTPCDTRRGRSVGVENSGPASHPVAVARRGPLAPCDARWGTRHLLGRRRDERADRRGTAARSRCLRPDPGWQQAEIRALDPPGTSTNARRCRRARSAVDFRCGAWRGSRRAGGCRARIDTGPTVVIRRQVLRPAATASRHDRGCEILALPTFWRCPMKGGLSRQMRGRPPCRFRRLCSHCVGISPATRSPGPRFAATCGPMSERIPVGRVGVPCAHLALMRDEPLCRHPGPGSGVRTPPGFRPDGASGRGHRGTDTIGSGALPAGFDDGLRRVSAAEEILRGPDGVGGISRAPVGTRQESSTPAATAPQRQVARPGHGALQHRGGALALEVARTTKATQGRPISPGRRPTSSDTNGRRQVVVMEHLVAGLGVELGHAREDSRDTAR